MFKKEIGPGSNKTKVKSSVQRAIRAQALETYQALAPYVEEMMPKKSQLDLIKLPDRVTLYVLDGQPLFFQMPADHSHGHGQRNGDDDVASETLVPTLRLVHRFPTAFAARAVQIDRGAIRFVLGGATLMVPGLTSPGGRLPAGPEAGLRSGQVVVVRAEGKEEVCMVGTLKMGTEEMKRAKKGVAVEGGHYLGDGLWRLKVD
ncbi:MAG: translation machinery-associated protein 20 [Phylliscum demangeonii]|nr:MAG: translation machinery-associated protein 20 [Phylliscum demangeonii]